MTSVKLYKTLQNYVGIINSLAVKLSEESITKDEAKKQAKKKAKELLVDLKD